MIGRSADGGGSVGFRSRGAGGATEVDLALVLAVDISRSMEPAEQELQREGFVEAFRSKDVHHAILGPVGAHCGRLHRVGRCSRTVNRITFQKRSGKGSASNPEAAFGWVSGGTEKG